MPVEAILEPADEDMTLLMHANWYIKWDPACWSIGKYEDDCWKQSMILMAKCNQMDYVKSLNSKKKASDDPIWSLMIS